jgi:hypothetical protein
VKKVLIPLAGMPNQRDMDSLQSLIEGKDQRFRNVYIIPIDNPITGQRKIYVEKRPGFEQAAIGDCLGLISEGCSPTAIHFSRATGKYITAFCGDDIYVDCTFAGGTVDEFDDPLGCLAETLEVWNTRDHTNTTFSSDYFTSTQTVTGTRNNVRVTHSKAADAYYIEFEIVAMTSADLKLGFRLSTVSIADAWNTSQTITIDSAGTWGIGSSATTVKNSDGAAFSQGDRVQLAINFDNKKLWQRVNGGSWGSGANPVTGANPQIQDWPDGNWFIYFGTAAGDATQDSVQLVLNSGDWADSAPSGFCTWKMTGWMQTDSTFATLDNRETLAVSFGSNGAWRRSGSVRSGKKYFEFEAVAGTNANGFCVGYIDQSNYSGTLYDTNPYGQAGVYVITNESAVGYVVGTITNGTIASNSAYNFGAGDVIGVACDFATGKVWFAKNNTWITGDPAAGTGGTFTLPDAGFDPIGMNRGHAGGDHRSRVNFLSEHLIYDPPTGFSAFGG